MNVFTLFRSQCQSAELHTAVAHTGAVPHIRGNRCGHVKRKKRKKSVTSGFDRRPPSCRSASDSLKKTKTLDCLAPSASESYKAEIHAVQSHGEKTRGERKKVNQLQGFNTECPPGEIHSPNERERRETEGQTDRERRGLVYVMSFCLGGR